MWWRTVLIFNLLAITQSTAQLDNNGTATAAPRCCPCPPGADAGLAQPGSADQAQASSRSPGSADQAQASSRSPGSADQAQASSRSPGSADQAQAFSSPGRVECPCLARDADAQGSASVFVPHSVRAPGNVLRPEPKEDVKPLLHPEVDLASSVLETLREATDEEYREALARDAVRAASPDVTLTVAKVTPEEKKDVVTIIVSPQDMDATDDLISEASHVQETRCIHSPLGNTGASFNYRDPHNGLDDILNLPLPGGLLHRQRDSNLAASDVHENVVQADRSLNRVLSGLKLKADPSLFNLALLSDIGENRNNIPSNQIEEKECLDNKKVFDINQRNLDNDWSPSDVQTQFVEATDRDESNVENVAVFPKNKLNQFPLKNIFKLRDVELVPLDKMIQKSKYNTLNFKLDPFQNKARAHSFDPIKLPKLSDLLGKPSRVKSNEGVQKNDISDLTNSETSTNIQAIPKKKEVMTEILDALPSPSEANHVVSAKDNCLTSKPEVEKLTDRETGKADDLLDSASIETLETSAEQVSDSTAINEDDNVISGFNQAESMESKSGEGIEDTESGGSENIEIIDDSQGFDQETEREIIISQEDIIDVPISSVDLSEINEAKERNNDVAEEDHPFRSLEAIRKSVVEKLDMLQNNNRIELDNIKHSVEEISKRSDAIKSSEAHETLANSEEHVSDSDSEPSSLINVNADELKDVSTSTEEVSIDDLQNMSDSILIASEKGQQNVLANNKEKQENEKIASQTIQSEERSEDVSSDSENISESEIDKVLGMDETGQLESKESRPENQINEKHTLESTCTTDLQKTSAKSGEMSFPDTNKNEEMDDDLETHASEPTVNSILGPNSKSQIEHFRVLGNNKETQEHDITASQTIQSEEQFDEINSDVEDKSETEKVLEIDEAEIEAGQLESKESKAENQINPKDKMKNTCATDLRSTATKVSQINFPDTNENEEMDDDLESHASEPIVNSMLRPNPKSLKEHLSDFESKLRQNLIVQPTPLINTDDLNIFNTPALSIPDISDLSANIPTLEEIRARVSEILGGLARHADDEDVSYELDSDDFASNVNPVLATRTDSISPLQPLKDINLDIIQLKPLPLTSGTNPLKTEFPGLNLNTYRAKLAVPRTLDLKPLNLASTLGNDGGLVGAMLSIEPEKKLKVEKSKVKAKFNPNLRHSGQNSLINYPALADVTASVQKNAQNLLNIPKAAKGQTLQASNVINNIAENLEFHTKNIHQTLNPPCSDNTRNNLKKNANHRLNSGRNALETFQASPIKEAVDSINAQSENTFRNVKETLSRQNSLPPVDGVVDNLRSQTESVMKNIQQTLKVPNLSHINNSIQKNTQTAVLRSSLQPNIPLDTVVDNLKSQTQSTMRNIQKTLRTPTLSDISATVQKHAQDLKLSPVAITGRDAFGNVLQASVPIDLRPHTEKAVKDLQKSFKATLRNSPIKHLQPLANPNHVIQMITDHQEDVNDKLFAIHTDLNDRLESMHSEIMDPDRLRSILSPPSNRHFELFAIPLPNSRMTAPKVMKQRKPALKNKQPSLGTQRKEFRKPTVPKVSKPKPGTTKLGLMRASADKARNSPKSFKIASAASAPGPVHTHRQILPVIPKKPIITKPLERESLRKPLSQSSSPKGLQAEKKPFVPKDKPLTQSKIKITARPTTLRPNLAAPVAKTNKVIPTTTKPKISDSKRFKPKPPVRQPTPWNGWGEARSVPKLRRVGDPQTSPSHAVPKIQSPIKSDSSTAINKATKIETPSRLSSVSSRLKPETLKKPKPNLKLSATQEKTSNPDGQFSVGKPKNSLLSKLTEALKNRQAKANLSLPSERSSSNDLDMGTAPSEQVEKVVALGEPIKENVSYKCKMMCVKVDNLLD